MGVWRKGEVHNAKKDFALALIEASAAEAIEAPEIETNEQAVIAPAEQAIEVPAEKRGGKKK